MSDNAHYVNYDGERRVRPLPSTQQEAQGDPCRRWSQVNVRKVQELTAAGRMRPAGVAEVEAAKADGRWDAAYESQKDATVPPDLAAALAASPRAAEAFEALGKTDQYAVILDVVTARTPETRSAHLRKAIAALEA